MIDWLLAPIDPARGHAIAGHVVWHARLMVLAWSVLFPVGVLAARFYKITPRQRWPEQLDNAAWWRVHLYLQSVAGALVLVAVALVWPGFGLAPQRFPHALLGWAAIACCAAQFLGGWLRGTKGGPTAPRPDGSWAGDHYDMTARRRIFERLHKSLGYVALLTALAAMTAGLWQANAPRWMWLVIGTWWVGLGGFAVHLQRQGRVVDTYQAIWGPDPNHPGNGRRPIGWGVRRPSDGKPPPETESR